MRLYTTNTHMKDKVAKMHDFVNSVSFDCSLWIDNLFILIYTY